MDDLHGQGKCRPAMPPMTVPEDEPRRPGVYARLAEEAETHRVALTPPGWVRWVGWAICLAIAAGVVAAALQVHPW